MSISTTLPSYKTASEHSQTCWTCHISRLQECQPFSGASFLRPLSVCTKFECCSETGQNPPLAQLRHRSVYFASHRLAPSTSRHRRSIAFAFGSLVRLLRLPFTCHLPTPPSSSAVSCSSEEFASSHMWSLAKLKKRRGPSTSLLCPFLGTGTKHAS